MIQEITPDGREAFRCNSRDHVAVADRARHAIPPDCAHLNPLRFVEGDIVATLRGCSAVLLVDAASGEGVWLLGRSNRDGRRLPMKMVGDPRASSGDCTRLACSQTPGRCSSTMAAPAGWTGRADARGAGAAGSAGAVEYAPGPEAGTATVLRHHGLHGARRISWGRGRQPPATPAPPDAPLAVRIEHDGSPLPARAHRVGIETRQGAGR